MREYLPGERPFESLPAYSKRYTHLWVGIVRRYDQENEVCDVEWITYAGGRPSTGVPLALSGPRTYMGGPPEEGSYVYCHWVPHLSTGNYQPVIVAYAPTGHRVGKQFALVRTPMDEYMERYGTRLKMPKLYPGDLAMVSSAGSQVIADENLLLGSGGLTETLHRSSDMAIYTTALQHYTEGADSRVRWGMVERDAGWVSGALPGSEPLCEDGLSHHYITKGLDASRLEDGSPAWVEHRVELRDSSLGDIPINDGRYLVNSVGVADWSYRSVLGTLVGNQASYGSLYGKPLVRLVLSGTSINRAYQEAADAGQESTATSWAHLSVGVEEHSPTASADWDKSGRLALSLGKTAGAHPAGADKSLQIAADGNLDAVFGTGSGYAGDLKFNGDYREEVTQDLYSLVGNDSTTSVTNNLTLTIGGDTLTQVSGAYDIQGSTTVDISAGADMDLSAAANMSISSTVDTTITAGGLVDIEAAGTATLNGSLVYLGSGSVSGAGRPY